MIAWQNLKEIVPHEELRELLVRPLQEFYTKFPEQIDSDIPVQIQLHVFEQEKLNLDGTKKTGRVCLCTVIRKPDTSKKVMIFLCKAPPIDAQGNDLTLEHKNILLRIDVPFFFAFDKYSLSKYTLYHIRFSIPEDETRLTEKDCGPLFHGYIGITKRGYMTRFLEHYEKAKTNTGYLFHSIWHSLLQEEINMYPVVQLNGSADTLKEVYRLEEELVGEHTLTPKGLNAIPGGMAGIKMMHELRLLTSTKVGVDERDAALEALQQKAHAHGSPCAHYRRGHMRKLESGRLVYVNPCWVNLKSTEEISGQNKAEDLCLIAFRATTGDSLKFDLGG